MSGFSYSPSYSLVQYFQKFRHHNQHGRLELHEILLYLGESLAVGDLRAARKQEQAVERALVGMMQRQYGKSGILRGYLNGADRGVDAGADIILRKADAL